MGTNGRLVLFGAFALQLCAATAWTGAARADAPAGASARAAARARFERGKRYQDAGQYDQALAEYQAAYDLVPIPELLYNLAQVLRLKGDRRAAIAHYRRYLDAEPNGRGSADAREHLQRLSRELEAEGVSEPTVPTAPAGSTEGTRPAAPLRPAAPHQRRAEPSAGIGPARAATPPGPTGMPGADRRGAGAPGRGLRVAGLVTAAAGVVLLGVGVNFALEVRDSERALQQVSREAKEGGWSGELVARAGAAVDDGEGAERNMVLVGSVGAGALIAGGVLWVVGARAARDRETRSALRVAPLVGRASAGLIVAAPF